VGLPAYCVGRLFRFKPSELDEWVRAGDADDNRPDSSGKAEKRWQLQVNQYTKVVS
jgi:hypothetical protein